ncbi:hypothetical protein FNV43_RR16183 [Rhamnella rubrinervis]|uniref:Fatty acyl-CoA reductase n=1 Tax=Rhamnella rubrinervis TaxID=2594499 RepID=A0A8K0EDN9_9ROSA|nr:hypothetical protein FNV43_RR16183 [Rhamnella rubrinervis]
MELESIVQFLENKTILVTGATGFLGKMLVEKVLRVQPNVKKIYLLIRASDNKSASQRMHTEVIGKELFCVLREQLDTDFDPFISEKVAAISGDVSCEDDLGVKDDQLRDVLWTEIDILINSAGTTNFDERYDVAMGTNTLGVLNVIRFSKKCVKLQMLVHVSTAYICGEREGLIKEETMFYTGKPIEETTSKLDFKIEQELVAQKLKELRDQHISEDTITTIMRDFGSERAKLYGWPNTYVFTKAMGEICLRTSTEILPLLIVRPTMVTSTVNEPFPGWIEGCRTVDGVIVGYGKGKLKCFLSKSTSMLDLIPGDMVVNLILVALTSHANQSSEFIYQIGSSLRNPIYTSDIQKFVFQYFSKNPLRNKKGKLIKVGKLLLLSNMAILHVFIAVCFILPLKVLKLGSIATCQKFPDSYSNNKRKVKLMMRLLEFYKPYVLFNGIFDDENSEKLRLKLLKESWEEMDKFNFDPKSIDWENYMMMRIQKN